MRAYLDHAASTSMVQAARIAVCQALEAGNPASVHAAGRAARRSLELAREGLAAELGITPTEVIFTSGGTEADNLAVKGLYWARRSADPRRTAILVSATEHHAVLEPAMWLARNHEAELIVVPVLASGEVDLVALEHSISQDPGRVALVAVMLANNEVGTINPICAVADMCLRYGVALHVDAVQAFGVIPVSLGAATTLALSAHKFGGPMGIGALAVARSASVAALHHGGGQERGLRSGTPNVVGAAGMAAAVGYWQANRDAVAPRIRGLRDLLIAGVVAVDSSASCNTTALDTLPGVAHLTFPGHRAESMLMVLDAAGVSVSTGAACSAGVHQPSHVLAAMGQVPESAASNLRVSLGHDSTVADVDAFLAVLPQALDRSVIRVGARA